jgi:hypothetical protein
MRNPSIEIRGQTYGRLRVLEYSHRDKNGKVHWLCECTCGNIKVICGGSLRSGLTNSCGCLRRELGRSQQNLRRIWSAYHRKFKNRRMHRWKNIKLKDDSLRSET